jgi:hypothetical protein
VAWLLLIVTLVNVFAPPPPMPPPLAARLPLMSHVGQGGYSLVVQATA